jgi:hypothetical protein
LEHYFYEISQHLLKKRIGDDMSDRCALPRSSSNQHIAGCMQMALLSLLIFAALGDGSELIFRLLGHN